MRLRLQKGDKSKWAENRSGTRFPNLGPSPTGSKTRRHVSPLSFDFTLSTAAGATAGRFARSRPDPVDSARPVSSQAPAGVELAPDHGRLSIFLSIVVGLVVWLYRRVGFPVMSFPPVCRCLRAVSGECGVEVSSGDGLVRFASSSTVTRRCFCLRCSFSVGGCFLPGGGAVGAVAAGSVSRAGGVYSVSSFGPSLVLGSSGILGRFVSLRGFSSGRRDGCEDDFSFHISDVSAGDGCSRFVYQLFAKSGWFFCPTSVGGLLSLLGVTSFGLMGSWRILWRRVSVPPAR